MSDDEPLIQIGELASAAGLTVRTLHHYDAIGLLVPSRWRGGCTARRACRPHPAGRWILS